LVKAAQAAAKGEEAVKSLAAVRAAAKEIKGAEVAERIVAQVKNLQKGEAAVVQGAKLTTDELKLLQKAGKTAEEAAASGIGKGVKTATGEVNLSKSGHIFTCASPCTELGEKYAKVFAHDGELNKELIDLRARASKVAQAEKAAKEAKDAKAIAKADDAAEQIKKDAAALEKRILEANPQLVKDVPDEAAASALKQAEAESSIVKGRLSDNVSELEKIRPIVDKPPPGVSPDNPMWIDYVSYFNDRLEGLKSGAPGVKPPLPWESYSDFLGKFQRGTKYQESVLESLEKEAGKAKKKEFGPDGKTLFGGMEDPIVESNVAVLEKSGKVSKAGQPVHNFPDQLIVDAASIGPGKTPKIHALSNKSHNFDEWFKSNLKQIQAQVNEDVQEALSKYGGEITLKRPTGKLAPLYNQSVKVEKVVLIYDAKLATSSDVKKLIRDAAMAPGIEVIFK
jgi:hypothetical protein